MVSSIMDHLSDLSQLSLNPPGVISTTPASHATKNGTQVTASEAISRPAQEVPVQDQRRGSLGPASNAPRQDLGPAVDKPLLATCDPEPVSLDWTLPSSRTDFSDHVKLCRSIDWSQTPLGPLSSWSPQLRQMANLVMIDPGPCILFWGPQSTVIYNEHYILMAGQNHPRLMGSDPFSIFPDAWDHFATIFKQCRETGQAIRQVDVNMFFNRHGYIEEAYFTFDMLPILGSEGSVVGFLEPVRETTKEKLAERRLSTLLCLGQLTADARSLKDYWKQVLHGLTLNGRDAPFAILYSVQNAVEKMNPSAGLMTQVCELEGTIGVPDNHPCAIQILDLMKSSDGFAPAFKIALKERTAMHLQRSDKAFPETLLNGIESRGFEEPCQEIVVLPVYPTASREILGFLVVGINTRRAYDDQYRQFIQLLERQLSSSVAGIVLLEEEMRRAEVNAQIAAADRDELLGRVEEMETRFKQMAEHAPVGMFNYEPDGSLIWANATWYEITGHPVTTSATLPFMELIDGGEAAVEETNRRWSALLDGQALVRYEIQLKKPWMKQLPGTDETFEGNTWVLASAYPEFDEVGGIKSIMGTITDISEQKWAEGVQDNRRKEAEELKRQQENFIDMVSHEMRNPLSAIIQSSDGIIGLLSSAKLLRTKEEIADIEDSVETILLCAQHQKRIIDDILTLSKLDSDLLSIIPTSIQPLHVVQRALKMFSGECIANNIDATLTVKNSFHKMNVDWVMLDPGRLLQVLVNLITNAIKITIPEQTRKINLSIGASLKRPMQNEHQINYLPTKLTRQDSDLEAPEGNEFFLKFAVSDTGAGLTEAESQKLFKRFSQALPRTHVQYSGSGLGLFISRELTEMQGGEIGFKSEPGKGSTFAFYIKATPTSPPRPSIKRSSSASKLSQTERDMAFLTRLAAGDVLSHSKLATSELNDSKDQLNILIVEDNLVNQKVLSKQLVNQNYIVHVANHGEEAIAFLHNTRFWAKGSKKDDVYMVLMDLEMPVMDGLTCIKKIRELQQNGEILGHVPVMAVTANARRQQIDSAISAGMDDVVCKPFRINELVLKMKAVKERISQMEDD
ncbi:hypothetical protein BP5796_07761 [Coleophoma crateriformis]|uniref:Uncharacterized protein n=1 Tax=Coleophoma crateriformis TaxID=565419 RepID=A0A3D8RCE0_9HELO|nr:hypothetical protein BP5796_07761 [Coleophoma crateriformis]